MGGTPHLRLWERAALHELLDLRVKTTATPDATRTREVLHPFHACRHSTLIYQTLAGACRRRERERKGARGGAREEKSAAARRREGVMERKRAGERGAYQSVAPGINGTM